MEAWKSTSASHGLWPMRRPSGSVRACLLAPRSELRFEVRAAVSCHVRESLRRAVLPALRTMPGRSSAMRRVPPRCALGAPQCPRPAERSRAHEAALAAAEGIFRDAVKAEMMEGMADTALTPVFRRCCSA